MSSSTVLPLILLIYVCVCVCDICMCSCGIHTCVSLQLCVYTELKRLILAVFSVASLPPFFFLCAMVSHRNWSSPVCLDRLASEPQICLVFSAPLMPALQLDTLTPGFLCKCGRSELRPSCLRQALYKLSHHPLSLLLASLEISATGQKEWI